MRWLDVPGQSVQITSGAPVGQRDLIIHRLRVRRYSSSILVFKQV